MKIRTKYTLAGVILLSLSVTALSDIMMQPSAPTPTVSTASELTSDNEKKDLADQTKNEVKIGNIHLNMDEINKDEEKSVNLEKKEQEEKDSKVTVIESNGTVMTVKNGEYHATERIEDGKRRTEVGIVRGNVVTIQSGQDAKAVSNVGVIK